MSLHTWDVRAFAGKQAKIEVVDRHTSGWGNIGIDRIVFLKRSGDGAGNPSAQRIVDAWRRERDALRSQVILKSHAAPAMMDGNGEDDHILIRGNSSKPGKVEPRHFLTAITGDSPMQFIAAVDGWNSPRRSMTTPIH